MTEAATGPIWLRWADTPIRAVLSTAGVGSLLVIVTFLSNGIAENGWRLATRHTVQLAFPLFLLAFVASSLVRLAPSRATRALLARRRAIGLAFATMMALHGFSILGLSAFDESLRTPDVGTFVGGLAYVFIGLMAATSNEPAVRRLGEKRWRTLHCAGLTLVCIAFLATYGGQFAEDPGDWLGLALLVGAFGLRIAAAFYSAHFRRMTLPTE